MLFRGLRRAYSRRKPAASGKRQGASRACRLENAGEDTEAPHGLRQSFAKEAEHGMMSFLSRPSPEEEAEQDEIALATKFHEFYDNKVMQLQEKEGGEASCPVTGNLYMYKCLQAFGDETGLFQKKHSYFVQFALLLIIFVQIVGPVALFVYSYYRIEFIEEGRHGGSSSGPHDWRHHIGLNNFFVYEYGSQTLGISHLFQRILGLVFLVLFLMNGMYVLANDREETKKVTELMLLFKEEAVNAGQPAPKSRWLWLGAFINSFCLMACSFAMVVLFIIEEGPKDVILDAFGLAFLYNLDDIGGDLAFLDEKWDEDLIGDIYGELATNQSIQPILLAAREKREGTFTPDTIYWVMEYVMKVMLVLLPLFFMCVEMKVKEEDDRRLSSVPEFPAGVPMADLVRALQVMGYSVGA